MLEKLDKHPTRILSMPFAVTHALVPVILLDFLRGKVGWLKNNATKKRLVLCGVFGVMPDIDVLITIIVNLVYSANVDLHRTFTHMLFAPLLVFLAALPAKKWRASILFACFGWLSHILLDFFVVGKVPLLYPLILAPIGFNFLTEGIRSYVHSAIFIGLDIAVLLFWVWYKKLFFFSKKN